MTVCFLLFFASLFFVSCSDNSPCLKSNGEIVTYEKELDYFSKLDINGVFDVKLEHSNTSSVVISSGENIIPFITCEVSGNRLTISDENKCRCLRKRQKPEIIVRTPLYREINVNEACDLATVDTLYYSYLKIINNAGILNLNLNVVGDSLEFRSFGYTGNFYFTGFSRYAYFYHTGSSYLKARAFFCKQIHLVHFSNADSEVNASDFLHLEKIENGKVYSFSANCPTITPEYDYGDRFENMGCGR